MRRQQQHHSPGALSDEGNISGDEILPNEENRLPRRYSRSRSLSNSGGHGKNGSGVPQSSRFNSNRQ